MTVLVAGLKHRRAIARIAQRPGALVYGLLTAVLVASVFPFYWSFLIGSGDGGTLSDTNMSWLPGGNFLANAASVINNESVNFWKALTNSIIVSSVVSVAVVFFSTLAGFAFAKGRFTGQRGLLLFVIATMCVPTQLSVVPLFIAMSTFGWTGTLGAVIIPGLVTAFGLFWLTQ